jgi:hypothetical protein
VRRTGAFALVAALVAVVFGPAAPGSATTYYDYWGYWHKPPGATSWQYSKVGAGGYYVKPGTQVEGWRFGTGTASQNDPKPRPAGVSYDDYCAGHDTGATYRVLLIVDYGTQSGAPAGPVYSCYGWDSEKSGQTVLTQQHSERDSGGLICGIDGYPKSGCGEVVSSPAPKPTRTPTAATSTPRPPGSSGANRQPTSAPKGGSSNPTGTTARGTTSPGTASTAATIGADSAATGDGAAAGSTANGTPSPSSSASVVASRYVPPRRSGGVPVGFVAGCLLILVIVAAALLQRRRRG